MRRDRPNSIRVVSADGQALTASDMELKLKASAHGESVSPLPGADLIMNQALFLGTYPGLTSEMLAYEIAVIDAFVKAARAKKN